MQKQCAVSTSFLPVVSRVWWAACSSRSFYGTVRMRCRGNGRFRRDAKGASILHRSSRTPFPPRTGTPLLRLQGNRFNTSKKHSGIKTYNCKVQLDIDYAIIEKIAAETVLENSKVGVSAIGGVFPRNLFRSKHINIFTV